LNINKILTVLFFISIFLIPFDSFPLFPTDSVYRPISFFPLIVAFIVMIYSNKINRFTLYLFFATVGIFVYSIILSSVFFDSYLHLTKAATTLVLFFIMLSVFHAVIKYNLQNNERYFLQRMGAWSFYSLIFISLIGFIQFSMKINLIPFSLADQITSLFSYRWAGRMQMVSGEPSWMVRNLLFLGVFIYFFYFGKYRRIAIGILLFFLFISGSTYGYLTIFLFIFCYVMLFRSSLIFNLRFIFGSILIAIIFLILKNNFLDGYTLNKLDIVYRIFTNFDSLTLTIMEIVKSDGSAFQRIMNPIIGFMSGESTNYLGTGIDGYRYIYPYYIENYFPFAMETNLVSEIVSGEGYATPKSLYSKIYAELGLIPFLLFLSFLIYLYRKIRKLSYSKHYLFLSITYSLSLVYILNADSIINLNYFLYLVLIALIIKHENRVLNAS